MLFVTKKHNMQIFEVNPTFQATKEHWTDKLQKLQSRTLIRGRFSFTVFVFCSLKKGPKPKIVMLCLVVKKLRSFKPLKKKMCLDQLGLTRSPIPCPQVSLVKSISETCTGSKPLTMSGVLLSVWSSALLSLRSPWWRLLLCTWMLTTPPTSERGRPSSFWLLQAFTSRFKSGVLPTITNWRWRGWLAPTDLIINAGSSHLSRACISLFSPFRWLRFQVSQSYNPTEHEFVVCPVCLYTWLDVARRQVSGVIVSTNRWLPFTVHFAFSNGIVWIKRRLWSR